MIWRQQERLGAYLTALTLIDWGIHGFRLAVVNIPAQPDPALHTPLAGRHTLLRVYAYYRITLALLLLVMFGVPLFPSALGGSNPDLFKQALYVYLAISFVTLIRLSGRNFHPSEQQMFVIYFIDIFTLAILMQASGGVSSGLGLLLLITVSAASITLNSGQIAVLIAALATMAILASALYDILSLNSEINQLLPAGLLGFLCFVTSQLFLYLTRKMRQAASEAELQTRRHLQAQHLNELIVQRMRTGIVVLSPEGHIQLINESAALLLELPLTGDSQNSSPVSFNTTPILANCLRQWRTSPHARLKPIKLRDGSPELQLSFAGLDQSANASIIVFVEDTREIGQRAQQLKLASLGHLTASIAHEIRNPLGAISHAAQLLGESSSIGQNDHRLSEIIQKHSRRVNQIVENVLQLTGRRNSAPQKIDLCEFVDSFIHHYRDTHRGDLQITVEMAERPCYVNVDPSHLEQVLSNLFDNGLRYSMKATGTASLLLKGYVNRPLNTPCLDVIDDGEGIAKDIEGKIFEPFFTTDNQGTGLGLYLSRELCEINQARLDYKRTSEGKSCFQISFAHPDKLTHLH